MKKKTVMMTLAVCLLLSGCGANTNTGSAGQDTPTTVEDTTALPEETTSPSESETASGSEALKITPIPSGFDINNLQDATVSASFDASGVQKADDGTSLTVTVYDYELFDMVDMAQLKAGDTIVIDGEEVTVNSVEQSDSGFLSINGGVEMGGYDFTTNENGVYYIVGPDDIKDYQPLGTVTLPVDENCTCVDDSDLENPGKEFTLEDIDALTENGYSFSPANTSVTVAGGKITEIHRSFMP